MKRRYIMTILVDNSQSDTCNDAQSVYNHHTSEHWNSAEVSKSIIGCINLTDDQS